MVTRKPASVSFHTASASACDGSGTRRHPLRESPGVQKAGPGESGRGSSGPEHNG